MVNNTTKKHYKLIKVTKHTTAHANSKYGQFLTCECVVHIEAKELDLLQHQTAVDEHSGNRRDFMFRGTAAKPAPIRHIA